jgi:hypothetical protein
MRFNPFNPQQPARPQIFVGREPELDIFEKFLMQTMNGSSMNMAVTGNRGMGKTSMLIKFEDIAKDKGCLVVRISNYEGQIRAVDDLSNFIEESLRREIIFNKKFGLEVEGVKEFLASLRPFISYEGVDLGVEKRSARQEMLRDSLLTMWRKIRTKYPACVLMIDEAESLEKVEGGLIFLREVFQRIGNEANYMIVLAGKLSFPEKMSESFSPLNRFFPACQLQPLEFEDSKDFVRRQMASVKMSIDDEALHELHVHSEGHPYVLVAMCYTAFDSIPECNDYIDLKLLFDSRDKVLSRLGQDFFAPMYHPLSPKGKDVLRKIVLGCESKMFEFSEAKKWTGMGSQSLSPYLVDLVKKGMIDKKERGTYEFFHTLFIEYIKRMEFRT